MRKAREDIEKESIFARYEIQKEESERRHTIVRMNMYHTVTPMISYQFASLVAMFAILVAVMAYYGLNGRS